LKNGDVVDGSDYRDFFASLYEGTPDAVILYDRDGRFLAANAATEELTGYGAVDLAGSHYRDRAPDADSNRIDLAAATALAGVVDYFESNFTHKNGTVLPIELFVFPAKRNDEIIGFFAQARDITALRSAEESMGVDHQRFRSLFEFHPDGIMDLKGEGNISRVNVALESETGFLSEQLVGKCWTDILAPEFHAPAHDGLRAAMSGEATELEALMLDRLGKRIDVQVKLVPSMVGTEVRGVFAVARNVLAQKRAERAVAEHGERIRQLYLVAASRGESIEKQIDATIDLGLRMFGFDFGYVTRFDGENAFIQNAVGSGWDLKVGQTFPIASTMTKHLRGSEGWLEVGDLQDSHWRDDIGHANAPWRSYLAVQLRVHGRVYGALAFAGRFARGEFGELDRDLIQLMGLFVASALERAHHDDKIKQLAFNDPLTDLPNRRLFDDRIQQTLATARRYERGFAIMYLDLDHFKHINDTYGHPVGDDVLTAVASRLRATLRESDTVARFGGDEFVILQPIVDAHGDSTALARKIIKAMQAPIVVDKREHKLHVSIGIALYPQDAKTADTLLEEADRALYAAKHAGRNRWSFADAVAARQSLGVTSRREAAE
jgi:diguanylate cyclase (GGDEF)-like protein/PAS domain S-box-containing protein